jgi:hypothetical protein
MKKLLLTLAAISTQACAMQPISEHKKAQLSRMLCVNIRFANRLQAEEIRNDIEAAFGHKEYKPRFSDYEKNFWVWIDATENEIREQFKHKSWASQIKEIEGDCYTHGSDKQ